MEDTFADDPLVSRRKVWATTKVGDISLEQETEPCRFGGTGKKKEKRLKLEAVNSAASRFRSTVSKRCYCWLDCGKDSQICLSSTRWERERRKKKTTAAYFKWHSAQILVGRVMRVFILRNARGGGGETKSAWRRYQKFRKDCRWLVWKAIYSVQSQPSKTLIYFRKKRQNANAYNVRVQLQTDKTQLFWADSLWRRCSILFYLFILLILSFFFLKLFCFYLFYLCKVLLSV